MSIDPPGCKDIDDALHARQLENGNIEVGVHIADVTYYMKHNSALDLEVGNGSEVDSRREIAPHRRIWWIDDSICFPNFSRRISARWWPIKIASRSLSSQK